MLPYFFPFCIKFCRTRPDRITEWWRVSWKWCGENRILRRGVNESVLTFCTSYLDEIRYKRPAPTAVGRANGCMEGRMFLRGTYEVTLMRVLCSRIDWKIKKDLFEPVCSGTKCTITPLHLDTLRSLVITETETVYELFIYRNFTLSFRNCVLIDWY
jgi:hypothetical protein